MRENNSQYFSGVKYARKNICNTSFNAAQTVLNFLKKMRTRNKTWFFSSETTCLLWNVVLKPIYARLTLLSIFFFKQLSDNDSNLASRLKTHFLNSIKDCRRKEFSGVLKYLSTRSSHWVWRVIIWILM